MWDLVVDILFEFLVRYLDLFLESKGRCGVGDFGVIKIWMRVLKGIVVNLVFVRIDVGRGI